MLVLINALWLYWETLRSPIPKSEEKVLVPKIPVSLGHVVRSIFSRWVCLLSGPLVLASSGQQSCCASSDLSDGHRGLV